MGLAAVLISTPDGSYISSFPNQNTDCTVHGLRYARPWGTGSCIGVRDARQKPF
jgi:hypothetical protein